MTPRRFEERRRLPRVGIVRSMSLRLEGREGVRRADLLDLSRGGMRGVAVLGNLDEGAKVVVEIPVSGGIGTRQLRLPGILVRMRAPTGCDRAEFAVAFRPLKGSLARRLGRFMLRALRARAKLQTAQGPASPLADALRMLRVSLGRPTPGRARVVLVTSSVPGEGKSFTAGHLGGLLADEGYRVLLVDADLRRPALHRIFGLSATPGLADLLADRPGRSLAAVVQSTRSGAALIAAGSGATGADRGFHPGAVELLEQLRENEYDYVVVDSPALLVSATSSLLAGGADDVLLVARAGTTRERDLREAHQLLEREGANLLGVVLNDQIESREGAAEYYRAAQLPEAEPSPVASGEEQRSSESAARELAAPELH